MKKEGGVGVFFKKIIISFYCFSNIFLVPTKHHNHIIYMSLTFINIFYKFDQF